MLGHVNSVFKDDALVITQEELSSFAQKLDDATQGTVKKGLQQAI
jgi:hypothetical protein